MIRRLRQRLAHLRLQLSARRYLKACERLERDVERRKALNATYPKRRAAAKLGWQRRRAI